jgi:hypothetical protein
MHSIEANMFAVWSHAVKKTITVIIIKKKRSQILKISSVKISSSKQLNGMVAGQIIATYRDKI